MPVALPPSLRRPLRGAGVLAAALASALSVAACGAGDRTPSLKDLPLVPGAQVVVTRHVCDKGSNAYCALELVLTDSRFSSSRDMQRAERRLLKRHRWSQVNAPVGQELAADSPRGRLRVTYAAANLELQAADLGWVRRPRSIVLTLSRALFDHTTAMAVVLQAGTT